MSFVILDKSAAKTGDEFSEFLNLQPGLTAKLFTIVNGENDGAGNTVSS